MLNKMYIGETNNHKDTDGGIDIKINNKLPFLVLADGLIDKITILSETLNNDDAGFDIYGKDGDDEIEIDKMCNIFSKTAGLYSLYFVDGDIGYLTTLSSCQTLDTKYFVNRNVDNNTMVYPGTFEESLNSESIIVNTDNRDFSLPKPSSDFGNTITVKTVLVNGIKTFSNNNRIKRDIDDGSIYTEYSMLPLLEIDTNTFDAWDPKTLPFYTIIQESGNTYRLEYVGPQDVSKFYIPLQ